MSLEYYVIDIESNGLKAGWHEINQISIIRAANRNQLSRYIKIDHPERTSQEALDVTGRKMSDMYKGEPKLKVVEEVSDWISEDGKEPEARCFVGHNCNFDQRFCYALWGELGKIFPGFLWLDTKSFAKSYAEKNGIYKPKLSLAASVEFTGIKGVEGVHNAISDSRNCYLLWDKCMKEGLDHLPHIKRVPHEI